MDLYMPILSDLTKVMTGLRWVRNQECYLISKVKQVREMTLDWGHERDKEKWTFYDYLYLIHCVSIFNLSKLCKLYEHCAMMYGKDT